MTKPGHQRGTTTVAPPWYLSSTVFASPDHMANKTLKQVQSDATRKAIAAAIKEHRGNRTLAAEALGVSRSQLYRYMVELGMISKGKSGSAGRIPDGRFRTKSS